MANENQNRAIDYKARIENLYLTGGLISVCDICLELYRANQQSTVPHFAGLDTKTKEAIWLDMAPLEKKPGQRYNNYIYRPCPSHTVVIDEVEISQPRKDLERLLNKPFNEEDAN